MINSSATPAIALALATLAAGTALGKGRAQVRGTTLIAVWWWSAVSLAAVAAVECCVLVAGEPQPAWVTAARYAAAMTTFTPFMALLGAKRPQDRAWQWIVLTLAVVLCMPSGEWLLFGEVEEIHPARFWFLMILIAMSAFNGLATRRWPSSLLAGTAQLVLLSPHLGIALPLIDASRAPTVAIALFAANWWLIALDWPARVRASWPIDRAWLDFRDDYGPVWALRVAQRLNDSAARRNESVALGWHGFVTRDSGTPAEAVPPDVEEELRSLLGRFVSPAWIDDRTARHRSTT